MDNCVIWNFDGRNKWMTVDLLDIHSGRFELEIYSNKAKLWQQNLHFQGGSKKINDCNILKGTFKRKM